MIGQTLGPYKVLAKLGEGGMGEVYRATDTRLGREVALKFSSERFSERFEREARAVAALNHPNICTLYDVDPHYLVMELVEGPTLAERIAEGPIPYDEAMAVAAQIASALEEAHDKGITHRDLKPANIKVKADGTVKVLDFGLAKIAGPAAPLSEHSPTISMAATQAGVILGTASYMAPEQAKGKPVDRRADIWAFGVVVYEMLTGRQPFRGDDVGDVLAAVIKEEPAWDGVPVRARRALQRCLDKDPKKRLRDISGVALLLETGAETRGASTPFVHWAIEGTLAVLLAVAAWLTWPAPPVDRPLVRLDVDLGPDVSLGSNQGADVIISPAGDRLVYVSGGRLFTRRLDQPSAVELSGTQGAFAPFFSPDGRWVAFYAGGLKKVAVDGGTPMTLVAGAVGRGGTWTEDGSIIASLDGNTLSRFPEAGGPPAAITQLVETEVSHRWPHLLPGGNALLFTVRESAAGYDDARIEVLSLDDGSRKVVQRGGTFPRYVGSDTGDGHLVFVSKGTLFAVSFDLDRLEVRGTPSPVLENVGYNSGNGTAQFDVSRTGTLVYRGAEGGGLVTLRWLDASGKTDVLRARPASYSQPHLSPDGTSVALSIVAGSGQDLWAYDWQRNAMTRLTFGGGTYYFPAWHPDGRHIAFTGGVGSSGMFWTRADGSSAPRPLTHSKYGQFPWSFSPDGKRLAYAEFPGGAGDIWTLPVETTAAGLKAAGKPEVFLQTPANELFPAFSPDGRWIAYRSDESGAPEIYVRPFPPVSSDLGGKWLISNGGGVLAVWSPNGRELFYRTADQQIMVVRYTEKGDVFAPDTPRPWTETRLAGGGFLQNFDVARDGRRVIALMPSSSGEDLRTQNHVTFLLNFDAEVRRKLGAD